jgi:hypothetical protein
MALFSDDWRLTKDAGRAHRTIGAATEGEMISMDESVWSGVFANRVMVFHPVSRHRTGRALCVRIHAELELVVFGRLKENVLPGTTTRALHFRAIGLFFHSILHDDSSISITFDLGRKCSLEART